LPKLLKSEDNSSVLYDHKMYNITQISYETRSDRNFIHKMDRQKYSQTSLC